MAKQIPAPGSFPMRTCVSGINVTENARHPQPLQIKPTREVWKDSDTGRQVPKPDWAR